MIDRLSDAHLATMRARAERGLYAPPANVARLIDELTKLRAGGRPAWTLRRVHREQRAFDRGYDNAMEGIEERVREAQAEAWADGFAAATDAVPENVWFSSWSYTRNPYRDEEVRDV